MRASLVILGLVFAAPAAAQDDLPFSPAETETCLSAAQGALREVCIGLSAAACINSPNGYSTVGMSTCLGKEADYWDGRLNAAYQALLDGDGKVDADMAEMGSAAEPMAPALQEMQRAWIAFRDASCFYEYTQWGGGTGSGPASNDCVMRMTARQAMVLEDRLAQKQAQ